MGRLNRTAGGTRLEPLQAVKMKELVEEGEISDDAIVYEITDDGHRILDKGDTLQPGKSYGLIPRIDLGT